MTDTVIHFIGLIMFTMAGGNVTAIAPQAAPGVQPHTTMIVYKHDERNVVTGWTPGFRGTLTSSGWRYVKLTSADPVEFISDATNPGLTSLASVALPKVGGTLQAAYKAPYSEANAVFTIRNGTLAACASKSRVDTRLTLTVENALTIKSGSRSIVVPADVPVVILNLPFALADNPATYTATGHEHSKTYCVMTGQDWPCTLTMTATASDCTGAVFIPSPLRRGDTDATDFACSNTRWP